MTNIDQTIRTTLGPSISRDYDSHVRNVVTALTRREEDIKARLTRYASGRGLSQREIENILREVGLNDTGLQDTARASTENASALSRLAAQLSEQVADLNRRIQNL